FSSSFLCYPPLVVPQACADHPALLSFPTRRSSDLLERLRTMGAFAGTSARECYRVTCDRSTMTASDIDAGRVRCDVVLNPASPIDRIEVNLALLDPLPSGAQREAA